MATNKQLRADLLKELGGVTPQRLSQRVGKLKKDHGPMTTEDATYVLAHMRGFDLTRYLDDQPTIDRIRGMVPRGTAPHAPAAPKAAPKPGPRPSRLIRLGKTGPAVDLLLPKAVEDEAIRMATIYQKVYLLENSIRSLIVNVMTAKHGKDWWATHAPSEVRKTVQGRKDREDKEPWHGKRGAHEIFYSDFRDLGNIILKNWDAFKEILHKQQWVSRLEELEPGRNTVAHHNPISENEERRLEVFRNDWVKVIEARQGSIA